MLEHGNALLVFLIGALEIADSFQSFVVVFLEGQGVQVTVFPLKHALFCDLLVLSKLPLLSNRLLLAYMHQVQQH